MLGCAGGAEEAGGRALVEDAHPVRGYVRGALVASPPTASTPISWTAATCARRRVAPPSPASSSPGSRSTTKAGWRPTTIDSSTPARPAGCGAHSSAAPHSEFVDNHPGRRGQRFGEPPHVPVMGKQDDLRA